MSEMVKRNLKIYFRDKASVFFSMLSVIIIFALYILFIGDSVNSGLKLLPHQQKTGRGRLYRDRLHHQHHHVHFYLNFLGNLPWSGRRGSTGYRDFTKAICCNCLIILCIIGDFFLHNFFLEDQQLLLSCKHDSWDFDRLFGWGIHSNRQLARQRSMAGKVLPMCSFSGTLTAAFDEAGN